MLFEQPADKTLSLDQAESSSLGKNDVVGFHRRDENTLGTKLTKHTPLNKHPQQRKYTHI